MEQYYASEIHKLLKLGDDSILHHLNGLPEDLPVASHNESHDMPSHSTVSHAQAATATLSGFSQIFNSTAASKLKSFLVYPLIFILAFGFFFVALNFSSISAQINGYFATKPQDEQILGDQLSEYYRWISNYYYAVSDPKLLDPNNDIDKDGLSNHDEFIMKTNPIVADSDSDGFSDGIEVINNYNPWGPGVMTQEQKDLLAKLDLALINNRISYNVSQHNGTVASASTSNFNLDKPATLSIPKLNLRVDLIWSADPSDFETDLTKGVVHYPGTAFPGELGTIYVSGHSSDYLWKHDPMHDVFAKLNFLKPGDDIFVDVYGKDGKVYNYRYQVTGSGIFKPDDQAQFVDNSTYKLNLSTCWPIGTSKDRIVVSAVQVGL